VTSVCILKHKWNVMCPWQFHIFESVKQIVIITWTIGWMMGNRLFCLSNIVEFFYCSSNIVSRICKVVRMLFYLIMPWRHMGKWRCSYTILDLGNTRRWVVRFTPRPLYHLVPIRQEVGWALQQVLDSLSCWDSNPSPVARCYTDWAILTPLQIKWK
jgi:hypothetical protein